jgi:predicted ATPase/DNA-binding winged helix-turn-helix (wHTH) protein
VSERDRNLVYEAGYWQIHLGRRELSARGVAVDIGGRAFEILEVLAQSANKLVTKDELMDRVWPGATIGENTLQVHISTIRKAFGQDRAMLETASGRGYRLLGSWTLRHRDTASAASAASPGREPETAPANNFPLAITRLIGRAAAARQLQDLVSAYRVVTLTGPGGIGKSTLALDVACGILADFDGGGWFVELASLSDPGLVPGAVARALGAELGGATNSAEAVARAIGSAKLLLLLDNCEHVIDAVADLIEMIVRLCPDAKVMTTSREVLRVSGEYVFRVPPLEVPALESIEPDHILGHSAVELFVSKIAALDSAFLPRAEDILSIAAICRHLDGIPLAIEFAAARAATLGVLPVTVGLSDRFTMLTNGRRTALPRHQTLRATLDWSYQLLPAPERLLLRRLAIFPAGFTLDAAVAVMQDAGLDASSVIEGIANLVAKSLVAVDQSDAAARWFLLETIRAYALEKLTADSNTDPHPPPDFGYRRTT